MRRLPVTAVLAIAALLLLPAASQAGGWATVGLSSLPGDARQGDDWEVDLTILQHGVSPLEGVDPRVILTPEPASVTAARSTRARPTETRGVYRARVELPDEGTWHVSVDDGFGGVHDFGVVRMGEDDATLAGASRGDAPGMELGTALLVAALAGLLAAGLAASRGRGRGPAPAGG